MKFKTNKTKLIARVLVLVLLLTSAVTLTACPGWNGKVNRTITFESHNELLQFVEEYNSKNDGFVYTFVSFDFSDHSSIEIYEYNFNTVWKIKSSLITDEISYATMYDKDHSRGHGFGCEFFMHMDDIDTQIRCNYGTTSDYNFYQNDKMVMSFVYQYHIDDIWDNETYDYYSEFNNYKEEFADLRTFDFNTAKYKEYYDYMYLYKININGIDEITTKINSKSELSQETLDEICKILMDNIVIINTEG